MNQANPQKLPFPQQTPSTVCRMVRGHRMGALKDGWLVFYEERDRPAHEGLVDELCVVMTDDRRCLVRVLRRGRKAGSWDLLTVSGDQELDVSLIWAEPTTLIMPYKPSAELAHLLSGVS